MKHKFSFILTAAALVFFMACADDSTQKKSADEQNDTLVSENEKSSAADSKEDSLKLSDENAVSEKPADSVEASKYICPNSCPEGNADSAGSCPACGMDLVENPDYSEASN